MSACRDPLLTRQSHAGDNLDRGRLVDPDPNPSFISEGLKGLDDDLFTPVLDSGSDSESTDDESDSVRRGLVSHPDPRRRAKVVTKAGLETSLANTSVMPKGKRPKRPLPLGSRPSDSTIVDPTSPKVFGPKGSIVNSGIGREGNSRYPSWP